MSLRGWICAVALGFVAAAGCGEATEEAGMIEGEAAAEPDTAEALRQARADSVAVAEDLYDEAAFDSIAWSSDTERFMRGEDVWNFSCGDCHGWEGRGDGPVATRHGYDVPDFTSAGRGYAADLDSLRHRVFVGHETEMPSWGLYGLTPRDIDAVAYYIDEKFGEDTEPGE